MSNEVNYNTKPPKKWRTILADPPWGGKVALQNGGYGACKHYNLLDLEQIKSMPIGDLAEENAHCWLWVTAATLEHGYDVLRKWGFTPRSIFIWIKPRMGLGVYLRNCAEFVLLGTKGKAPIQFNSQMNWGFFPLQGHSHKPEEVMEIIKRCSPGPYLELFARRRYPGINVWGNEIESDVEIPGYPVPHYSKAINNRKAVK